MTYTKPELICLGDAMDAIQESMLKQSGFIDGAGEQGWVTVGAYASDE
jgi:hypothetical protein